MPTTQPCCADCGCSIALKIRSMSSDCPKGRWDSIMTPEMEHDFKKQIYLYSLNKNGTPGYDIITPIKTKSNEILLVNRGWIKKDLKNNKDTDKIETQSFEGIIKKITKILLLIIIYN